LQLSIQRRFAAGLQFGIAYTFSRSTDNGSTLTDVLPNAYDTHAYYGLSDFDRTHVLVANYIYDLPFFKTGNAFLRATLGSWEISGINQFQSGVPLSVRTSEDIAGVGLGSGNQFYNLVGDSTASVTSFTNSATWFNADAFAKPATGTFGVQPRNTIRAPGFIAWDMGLRKNFPIIESQTLQFRFEMFDILNHPNWSNPIVNPTSGSFGLVTGKTNDSRQLQLALKYMF
jgi:hypothetical protein